MSERSDLYVDNDSDIEKSAEVIYNELIRLHNLEMDAQDTLKDRANGIMVLNGTMITLVTLVMLQLFTLVVNVRIVLLFSMIPYTFFFISLFLAITSFLPRDFISISPSNLHINYYRKRKDVILEQLSSNFAEFIDMNKKITEERSKILRWSIYSFMLGTPIFVGVIIIILSYSKSFL